MADRQYPAMVYSKDGYAVVQSEDDYKTLQGSWSDTPVKNDDGSLALTDVTKVRATTPDLPILGEGNVYEDRVNWQLNAAGIKIDKRWSLETKLRKAQELQPLGGDNLDYANGQVLDENKFDFDPTMVGKAGDIQKEVNAKVAAAVSAEDAKVTAAVAKK